MEHSMSLQMSSFGEIHRFKWLCYRPSSPLMKFMLQSVFFVLVTYIYIYKWTWLKWIMRPGCMFYGLYKASYVAISFYSFIYHSFKDSETESLQIERLVIIFYTRHFVSLFVIFKEAKIFLMFGCKTKTFFLFLFFYLNAKQFKMIIFAACVFACCLSSGLIFCESICFCSQLKRWILSF